MLEEKLELVASLHVKPYEDLYKIIDFLNKNLKDKNVMFGLSKDGENMSIKIYEI